MGSRESLTFPSLLFCSLSRLEDTLPFFFYLSSRQPDGRECRQADDLQGL